MLPKIVLVCLLVSVMVASSPVITPNYPPEVSDHPPWDQPKLEAHCAEQGGQCRYKKGCRTVVSLKGMCEPYPDTVCCYD